MIDHLNLKFLQLACDFTTCFILEEINYKFIIVFVNFVCPLGLSHR